MNSILKRPGAWIPLAMSLIALALMIGHLAIFGIPIIRETDEGTAAHLFQIWMALEFLTVLFFAVKWIPRAPKQALLVLALQIVAALVPMAIVFSLNL